MQRARQEALEFPTRGVPRKGAGRMRGRALPRVQHRPRTVLTPRHPVHVTLRIEAGLSSLRKRRAHRLVRDALAAACSRFGIGIVHYSVMTNHVHLVCETADERALARGMKGLCVRISRELNALWARTGRVVEDRYHARALKSPREVRNALAYVLHNARGHGIDFAGPDPCSSGGWFDGWDCVSTKAGSSSSSPWPRARTWLLAQGGRKHGLIPRAALARRK